MLLSHLRDPAGVVARMADAVRPHSVTDDPTTVIASPRVIQAWGRRA